MASASAPGSRLTSLVNPYNYDVKCTYRYRLVANREEGAGGAREFEFVITLRVAKAFSPVPTDFVRGRRRGDRMEMLFAAPHMSAFGTKRTSRAFPCLSAF